MTKPIRWGICATGNVANDFCITLKSFPESEHKIVAVASRTLEKAQNFAKKFGIPLSLGSYQELAELKDVDIVYIATVPSVHMENSLRFINAGKNVLSEMPISYSLEGVRQIFKAAREKGVFYQEALEPFFNPAYVALRDLVRGGDLGELRVLQMNFVVRVSDFDMPRLDDLSLGGGMTMEMGSFMIRLSNTLFGDAPEDVQSSLYKSDASGVDKRGIITLRYPGGRFASIVLCDDVDMVENSLVLRGTKGTVKIPDYFWCPTTLVMPDGEVKEYPLPDVPVPEGLSYIYPGNQQFVHEITAVGDALNKGLKECEDVNCTHSEDTAAVLDIILAQNNIKY